MLDFIRLARTNRKRCIEDFKHPLNMWSVAEWGAATAGEVGEACNVAKKLIRIRDGNQRMNSMSEVELRAKLADEIADVILYADLWAQSQGIDLGQAIVDKFNRDSDKHGSKVTL